GLAGDSVRALLAARDGTIWIGLTNGLSCWKNEKFVSLTQNFAGEVIRSLCEDEQGRVWAGASSGTYCISNDVVILRLSAETGLPGTQAKALAPARDGGVWIGSFGGISLWNDKTHSLAVTKASTNQLVSALS